MNTLSRAAQCYILLIWSVALLLIGAAGWWVAQAPERLIGVGLLLPVLIVAEYFEVELYLKSGGVSITATGAIYFVLIAVTGPAGVLAVCLGTLLVDIVNGRIWYRSLFNAAEHSITYLITWAVYWLLTPEGAAPFSGLDGLIALVAVAAAYHIANSTLVSTVVALASQQSVGSVYRQSFGSVTLYEMMLMPLGALLVVIWQHEPWSLALGVIPLVMSYLAFQSLARAQERSRQYAALAAEAQLLANQRAQLLAETQQQQAELGRSAKLAAMGTFAAGIAHEFNNLLAGLLGHAELGLQSQDVAEKDESLQIAVNACMQGRSITAALLTFARHKEPDRAAHQLSDAIEHALALVGRDLSRADIRVERAIEPVPSAICDLGQIIQVVLNLLTNARDAMLPGGGVLRVSLAPRGEWVELRVSDTGHGIPEELHEQIFQPFVTTKGPRSGSSTPGTGLGLSISYGIIENHAGTITVESRVGEGTTFVVRLPAARAQEPEALLDGEMPGVGPMSILLVDDDPMVAEALAALLEQHGHVVTTATGAAQAMLLAEQHIFDFAICDVSMPEISGVELVERLRDTYPALGALLITGHADAPEALASRQNGAVRLLRKPFVADELLVAIAREALAPTRAAS